MTLIFRNLTFATFLLILSELSTHAEVTFFGRDFEDYKGMFCLKDEDLKQRVILDTPAGPSTFLATLSERGWLKPESKGVDLGYETSENMAKAIARGMRLAFSPYFNGSYRNWPEQKQTQFLKYFEHFNKVHSDFLKFYQGNPSLFLKGDIRKLERLFNQDNFDLILSSNLLFLYSDEKGMNEEFHRNSILSMAKVLKKGGEIRIFPIDNFKALSPEFFDHLLSDLSKHGLQMRIEDGCAPSVGQIINNQKNSKGRMLMIKKLKEG